MTSSDTSEEQRQGFLEARAAADVNPVAGRPVGIIRAADQLRAIGVAPTMFWPYFEIDYHLRSLLSTPADRE